MCCTITIGTGKDAGSSRKTADNAFGPPVDVPIAMMSIGASGRGGFVENVVDGVRGADALDGARPSVIDGTRPNADDDGVADDPCTGAFVGHGDDDSGDDDSGPDVRHDDCDDAAAGAGAGDDAVDHGTATPGDDARRAWVRRPIARIFGKSCVRMSSTEAAALPVDGLVT